MRPLRALVALAAALLLGTSSNQLLSWNDLNADTAEFLCTGTCPSSNAVPSSAQFVANYKTSGCGTASSIIWNYSTMKACAVVTFAHTPILANASFAGSSFAIWSSPNSTGCSTAVHFAATSTPAEDSDGGSASSSTTCSTSSTTSSLQQTFSISGTPTSQSYSLWYDVSPAAAAGDRTHCSPTDGASGPIVIKIGSTTIATVSVTADGSWHQATGSLTALSTGSNTISILATATASQSASYDAGTDTCTYSDGTAQVVTVDHVALTATY